MSELHTWLEKLAAMTAGEIRILMRESYCVGVPCDQEACPIALFLQRELKDDTISVGTRSVVRGWPISAAHDLPLSVAQFISAYDEGIYPELVG